MGILLMITGMPGVCKTTLAESLLVRLDNFKLLSLDKIKEEMFDIEGFRDLNEKKLLEEKAFTIFYSEFHSIISQGYNILTDYPFSHTREKDLMDNIHMYTDLSIYTVKLIGNHDIIYKRFINRTRHFGHDAIRYPILKEKDLVILEYQEYLQRNICKEEFELGKVFVIDVSVLTSEYIDAMVDFILSILK